MTQKNITKKTTSKVVKNEVKDIQENLNVKKGDVNKNIFARFLDWYRTDFVQATIVFSLVIMFIYGIILSSVDGTIANFGKDLVTLHMSFVKSAIAVAGPGNAILNAALFGLFHFMVSKLLGVKFTSVNFLVFWMLVGYTFIGVNFFGYVALLLGANILSLVKDKSMKNYYAVISLGTSVTPILAYMTWGVVLNGFIPGWWGFVLGFMFIMFIAMILPELGPIFFKVHEGNSLANTGISAGILMTIGWAVINVFNPQNASGVAKDDVVSYHILILIMAIAYFDLVMALILHPVIEGSKGFIRISKNHGKWPTDFIETGGALGAVFNIVALITFAYLTNALITLGDDIENGVKLFSNSSKFLKSNALGATAIYQVYAYGLFGKQIMSAVYLTIGILITHYIFHFGNFANAHKSVSTETLFGVIMLGWLLSPLIKYGVALTILAGMIHVLIIKLTGPLHGGIFVYNNGLSTLFTIPLIMAVAKTFGLDPDAKIAK